MSSKMIEMPGSAFIVEVLAKTPAALKEPKAKILLIVICLKVTKTPSKLIIF